MSNKKKAVMISLEIESLKFYCTHKFAGRLDGAQIAALVDLLDRYGLRIYDSKTVSKYTPTKEDLEK